MIETLAALCAGPWGPLVIFGLRIIDVSLGTVRMLLSVQGRRTATAVLGMVEVTIWVLAVGTAINNLTSPLHLLGYAGGFGAGSAIGLWFEDRLAFGFVTLRIMSPNAGVEAADALRSAGFGVTEFAAHGANGRVEVAISVVRRKRLREAYEILDMWAPEAFVTVEMPRTVRRGFLGQAKRI